MKLTKIKDYLHEKFSELINENFIEDFNPNQIVSKKKALLYYKCSQKFNKSKVGTTEYQSLGIATAMNKSGYIVTIVDRKLKFKIKKKYDLFVGAFNTGGFKHFEYILNQLPKKTKKIGLSTGANPKLMKKEFKKREKMFIQRNKVKFKHMTRYSLVDFNKIRNKLDYLIYFGYKKGFVDKSYYNFKKKINVQACISDEIKIKKKVFRDNLLSNYIYYSGSGFLHKGLDLVVEFFIKNPTLKLYICSANYEKQFLNFYNLKKYKNIFFKGNIKEDSKKAKQIFDKCGFIISMNCSGGGSAALAVGRRYGLIPVVLKNEDCNPKSCFFVKSENFDEIKKAVIKVSRLNKSEYMNFSKKNQLISNENSSNYYNKKFYQIFKKIS